MSKSEERILVIPAGDVTVEEGFTEVTLRTEQEALLPILANANATYQLRSLMEEDPRFLQLIPYIVITVTDSEGVQYVWAYSRGKSGGEKRLHGDRSIGVGGHISESDANVGDDLLPYWAGAERELYEEVVFHDPPSTVVGPVVGILYDPSNDVGRVHLGIVHMHHASTLRVESKEADLEGAGFVRVSELFDDIDSFENWSQLCIRSLFKKDAEPATL